MEEERETINQELAAKFDAEPDQGKLIALTKGDVALLINSLAELHESIAALHAAPFLLLGDDDGRMASSERHAQESYALFSQLANRLMAKFVDGGKK